MHRILRKLRNLETIIFVLCFTCRIYFYYHRKKNIFWFNYQKISLYYFEFISFDICYTPSILQFVAHPNVQQLLASIWYEGLPGFRQINMGLQFLELCRIGLLFPFFSIAYIVCPWASFSQKLRKPFIKFICSSSSYFTFLCKYWKTILQRTQK